MGWQVQVQVLHKGRLPKTERLQPSREMQLPCLRLQSSLLLLLNLRMGPPVHLHLLLLLGLVALLPLPPLLLPRPLQRPLASLAGTVRLVANGLCF